MNGDTTTTYERCEICSCLTFRAGYGGYGPESLHCPGCDTGPLCDHCYDVHQIECILALRQERDALRAKLEEQT